MATSGAGYVLGSGNIVDIAGLRCTCAGTMMVAASANILNQVCISYFLTCQINIHCINMHANLWFFMILHQILVFLMYPPSHTLHHIWIWAIWIILLDMIVCVQRHWTCFTYFTCGKTTQYSLWSFHTYFQVFEIKNDGKMKRTMRQPLPSSRFSPAHAAMWATSVGVARTTLLAWKVLAFSLHSINAYSIFFWNVLI